MTLPPTTLLETTTSVSPEIFTRFLLFTSLFFGLSFFLNSFELKAQVCSDKKDLHTNIENLLKQHDQSDKPITRLDTIVSVVKVVNVKDGDTAEILYHDLFLNVRFDHIDAPELRGSQAFSKAARRHLIKLIENKEVYLVSERRLNGGFGRVLGTFYTKDGLNVNKEMVAKGYAWHYKKYSKDQSYARIEKCARKHQLGLWKDERTIAPWNWRKGKR